MVTGQNDKKCYIVITTEISGNDSSEMFGHPERYAYRATFTKLR